MHRHPATAAAAGCPRQPHCALKFGVGYGKGAEQEAALRAADYVTIWLGSHSRKHGNGFNPYWHGRMLDLVRERNVTAVYYAYIIAKLARRAIGAKDCDAAASGEPSLCVDGAEFVRRNEPLILRTYEQFANETAARAGRAARVVWLIEPDWYQYHAPTQRGGGLPQPAMVRLFGRMVGRIKRHLPLASISLDVSPWVRDQATWLLPFLEGCAVDYLHTSGGRTTAYAARLRAHKPGNDATWAELHRITGRGIIADTGYGVEGGPLGAEPGFDHAWVDEANLRARIHDGIVAITQANPFAGWERLLPRLRSSLPRARGCFRTAHGSRAGTRRGRGNASRTGNHF